MCVGNFQKVDSPVEQYNPYLTGIPVHIGSCKYRPFQLLNYVSHYALQESHPQPKNESSVTGLSD